MELREGESWIVKTTDSIKLAPRLKPIVVGKTETPKRRKSSELECVEPVPSPHVVIAARGHERTFTKPQPSTRLQRAVNLVTSGDQLSDRQTSCHVQAVHTNKTIPKEMVKAEQASDKFCNSTEVGRFMGKLEYLRDEGVIYRRRLNGEHQL
jgi:ABC-type uncharacterized transport system involved in gliding motility auxiliary subunit